MTALPEALNKIRPQNMCVLQVLAGTVPHNKGEWEEEDTAGDVCITVSRMLLIIPSCPLNDYELIDFLLMLTVGALCSRRLVFHTSQQGKAVLGEKRAKIFVRSC